MMSQSQLEARAPKLDAAGLDISVRTGSGTGRTLLSAFDNALQRAGVGDFNLVTLSSVIPTGSRIRSVDATLRGGHGDLLFCVRAEAFADQPGDVAWAGLGWCVDETGGGLFVEHRGTTEESVVEQIELSLADMNASRGGGYGPVHTALASAECAGLPVCALVLAAYRVSSWDGDNEPSPQLDEPPLVTSPPIVVHEPSRDGSVPLTGIEPVVGLPTSDPSVSHAPAPTSDGVFTSRGIRVTVEKEIDYATARRFYDLYLENFASLEFEAAARHLLTESEFIEEMMDRRILKYVAWDKDDQAIGLTTLTSDLEAVPWISPGFYAHRFPEHHLRSAIYYLGITLVRGDRRGAVVFHAMSEPIVHRVLAERGIIAWDLCVTNDERGLSRAATHIMRRFADVTVESVDQQTYYAAILHGPRQTTTEAQ